MAGFQRSRGGILMPGARTNLLGNSDSAGTATNVTVGAGVSAAPAGTSRLGTLTGGGAVHFAGTRPTAANPVPDNTICVAWIFARNVSLVTPVVALEIVNKAGGIGSCTLNLSTGATTLPGGASAVGGEQLPGGWWRFWGRFSAGSGSGAITMRLFAGAYGTYSGDGQQFEYGPAQIEASLSPRTYVETSGAARTARAPLRIIRR